MSDETKFDRKKFNTDPAFQQEREQFDTMIEDSFSRIAERKKKEAPQNENIFDSFVRKFIIGG